jgi:hypothetical protein
LIPNKKQKIQNFHYTYSPKATSLHYNLKTLGRIIHQVKSFFNNNSTTLPNISQQINEINQQQNLQIEQLPTNPNMIPIWINNTQHEWKTLHKARDLENYTHIQQQITTATEKRCQALQTQPTKMINSILNRHTDHISFDNIKTENDLITDPKLIKNYIKNHFDNWTNYHPIDEQIFNNTWKNCYETNTSIDPQHYEETLKTITPEEISSTLQQLPNNKACGPSGISYEMLKYAGNNFLQAITILLNRCLKLQQIPKQ